MTKENIINETTEFVKCELKNAEAGHDWWHIQRVLNVACKIAETENVDCLIVALGALLHDIADAKFYDGNEEIGPQKASEFLTRLGVEPPIISHVENIIRNISFKGGNVEQEFYSPELSVVQDADRLDAIGAIGIARAFHYGGYKNRQLYDPAVMPEHGMTKQAYRTSTAPTINHFYEKLLLLKERMNTATGKKLAEERHIFMEEYLNEFFREWEGEA